MYFSPFNRNSPFNEVTDIDITNIKVILDLGSDTSQDAVLIALKESIVRAAARYIGVPFNEFPSLELDWVIDEITLARFSQLNSEGLKTESTNISRYDYRDDLFQQWLPFFDRWIEDNRELTNRRKLRML